MFKGIDFEAFEVRPWGRVIPQMPSMLVANMDEFRGDISSRNSKFVYAIVSTVSTSKYSDNGSNYTLYTISYPQLDSDLNSVSSRFTELDFWVSPHGGYS